MADIVLKVRVRDKLQDNDLLVYNKKDNCWDTTPKAFVFHDLRKEIRALNLEIDALRKEIDKNEKNIQKMASILRGEIE